MIGKRRSRIDIYRIDYVADIIGGQIPIKILDKSTWAKVTELTGDRSQDLRRVTNKQPIEIIIRSDSYDITPENIIDYNGSELTIHSITTDIPNKITTVIGWASQ